MAMCLILAITAALRCLAIKKQFKAFKPFKKFKSFGARTARSSPLSFFVPDRSNIACGGNIEECLLHQFQSHVVQLAVSGANAIFQNDDIIAEIARAPRRAFDSAFGGDAAN